MKRMIAFAVAAALTASPGLARPYYGGGRHKSSHGGHFSGHGGSSHRGGHYTSRSGSHQYGRHR
jgi:hypothetical protein